MPYESALLSARVYLGVLHHGVSRLDQDSVAAYPARASFTRESRDDLGLGGRPLGTVAGGAHSQANT